MSNEAMIKNSLSSIRLSQYLQKTGNTSDALKLYLWNSEISAALLPVLSLCEVTLRNSIDLALSNVYGRSWAYNEVFHLSLPNTKKGFNSRQEIINLSQKYKNAPDQVIAEAKFIFWQTLLTKRHDERIWNTQLSKCFPNMELLPSISECRTEIYQTIEKIRKLRNRIAHHEPIFYLNIHEKYNMICQLIGLRCKNTENWIRNKNKLYPYILTKFPEF